MPKGLRFSCKEELIGYLTMWLDRSSHETVGLVETYGGSRWITVESEVGLIDVNRDTRREAVEALVASARVDRGYDWLVVANRNGTINRVLFCPERTPGWYAYLREPLARESPLGPRRGSPRLSSGDSDEVGEEAAVVQFPHPGGEHVPSGSAMSWNTTDHDHARKFLVSRGRFVDADGELRSGGLVFWGEWEPPSRIVARWPRRPGLPTVLHEPHWWAPDSEAPLHNTDPLVFGGTFLYSNCKQLTAARRPSSLQSLARGTVVLFGSKLGGEFVLDTVFVVGEVLATYRPVDRARELPVDAAFATCTIGALTTLEPSYSTATFTLFRGATIDDPVGGMYSFVPCRERLDDDTRFARPAIHLPGIVNPLSSQTPSGANDLRPVGEVAATWRAVVAQVRAADLDLGVHLDTPPRAA